ncbi:MAG: polysaccharide deacetylase family protein, partial [Desulfovibrionaceae bacterium]
MRRLPSPGCGAVLAARPVFLRLPAPAPACALLFVVLSILLSVVLPAASARAAGSVDAPPPAARADADRSALFHALWPAGFATDLPEDVKRGEQPGPDLVPPARTAPRHVLPPLPAAERGIVRRVDPADGSDAAPGDAAPLAALTFDLCERATSITGFEPAVPRILERYGARATFFLGGKWMRNHPERTLQILAHPGFEAGNHAWTHGNFGLMDTARAAEQVRWTQAQYELARETLARRAAAAGLDRTLTAVPDAPRLFRLPYGRSRWAALELLAGEGLRVIQWDLAAESVGGAHVEAR